MLSTMSANLISSLCSNVPVGSVHIFPTERLVIAMAELEAVNI